MHLAKVSSIEQISDDDEYVYDISVENSHLFFANDILVHNTDSIFLSFDSVLKNMFKDTYDTESDDAKVDVVLRSVKLCAEYLNKYLIKQILAKHNTPSEESIANGFDFEFKEELIIKKALFRDKKKKYAINIIFHEGKKVDKIAITGIEVVRSDFPRFSKDILNEVIQKILRENIGVSEIINLIYAYKAKYVDLLNQGSIETGIPCGWGIRSYTSIPRGIKGMMVYNALYGKKFKPGDKGYMFNLSNVSFSKLGMTRPQFTKIVNELKETNIIKKNIDLITIPEDTILDTTVFYPDVDNMLERAIFNRIEFVTDIFDFRIQNIDSIQW